MIEFDLEVAALLIVACLFVMRLNKPASVGSLPRLFFDLLSTKFHLSCCLNVHFSVVAIARGHVKHLSLVFWSVRSANQNL